MAWIVFGSFFLWESHAPAWLWPVWAAAVVYDFVKERRDSKKGKAQ